MKKIRNNHSERIDKNWIQSVGSNKAIEVGNNHDEVVGGNYSIMVGPTNLGKFITDEIARVAGGIGKLTYHLGLPRIFNLGRGNMFVGVEKSKQETVGISSSEIIGVSKNIAVGRFLSLNSGSVIDVHSDERLEIDAGETASLSAAASVEVIAGEARIVLERDGNVGIYGRNIKIGASKSVVIEADENITMKSKKIDLN